MPWSVTTPMTQRRDFVEDYIRRLYSMTDLCAHYRISRRIGYKWLRRFEVDGLVSRIAGARRITARTKSRSRSAA